MTMRVRVLRKFRSPATNRYVEKGAELDVPQSIFWFRRLKEKDCEKLGKIKKPKAAPMEVKASKSLKKGSK